MIFFATSIVEKYLFYKKKPCKPNYQTNYSNDKLISVNTKQLKTKY